MNNRLHTVAFEIFIVMNFTIAKLFDGFCCTKNKYYSKLVIIAYGKVKKKIKGKSTIGNSGLLLTNFPEWFHDRNKFWRRPLHTHIQ